MQTRMFCTIRWMPVVVILATSTASVVAQGTSSNGVVRISDRPYLPGSQPGYNSTAQRSQSVHATPPSSPIRQVAAEAPHNGLRTPVSGPVTVPQRTATAGNQPPSLFQSTNAGTSNGRVASYQQNSQAQPMADRPEDKGGVGFRAARKMRNTAHVGQLVITAPFRYVYGLLGGDVGPKPGPLTTMLRDDGSCTLPPDHGWVQPQKGPPIERVPVTYSNFYPQYWHGDPRAAQSQQNAPRFPQVSHPTDTTQLGYYYQTVPSWQPNPYMIPPDPNPFAWLDRQSAFGQMPVVERATPLQSHLRSWRKNAFRRPDYQQKYMNQTQSPQFQSPPTGPMKPIEDVPPPNATSAPTARANVGTTSVQ